MSFYCLVCSSIGRLSSRRRRTHFSLGFLSLSVQPFCLPVHWTGCQLEANGWQTTYCQARQRLKLRVMSSWQFRLTLVSNFFHWSCPFWSLSYDFYAYNEATTSTTETVKKRSTSAPTPSVRLVRPRESACGLNDFLENTDFVGAGTGTFWSDFDWWGVWSLGWSVGNARGVKKDGAVWI